MSFVFVSHASDDKPRIRHLVDALIARGHKVWLDQPLKLGYAPEEVRAHFHRLHAGRSYLDEIDEALRAASVVVVCFSRHFSKTTRQTWHDEAGVARALGKLVPCRVDDFKLDEIASNYQFQQMPDVSIERPAPQVAAALQLLIDDIERKLSAQAVAGLAGRGQSKRDEFAPFLVDRTDQEEAVGEALAELGKDGGVRAFFIAGPENECLEEFIARLEKRTCAARLGQGRSWLSRRVEWPRPDATPDFARAYQRRLALALGRDTEPTDAGIAAALAAKGRPVAVISLLVPSEWQADEAVRMRDWLAFWARIARQSQRFAALPLICLKMPPADPGWRDGPPGPAEGAAPADAQIRAGVKKLNRPPGRLQSLFFSRPPEQAQLVCVPLLHPVSKGHAERWLWEDSIAEQLGRDEERARAAIADLFGSKTAERHGIPLRKFAQGLAPLFRASG